ncbi:RNA polymerase sigma factor SigJ [Saccharibacillus sp. CPCC 101409]|uniref:RNA polymerase sigma factor SigJ n=1 Tax=Saccharibacillus sp. CPCC 101409 TaxID=3058041 RepID=UPI0026711B63|nr:RNA polymerase sigma factor SigJ [Saccharibacillus sp. CPCC 101409]MDO3408282.1 RNA polymerase sigma factor SigJ [Saccharibacillus sp. CPCC 101409]
MERDTERLYTRYRPLLFSLAYRMLGTAADAEDVVHDVFIRLEEQPIEAKAHMKAYLCKMTTNRCLDVLKSARVKREVYIGPWLPEPVPTGEHDPAAVYLQDESVSYAILLLLESLEPEERAVYILREAFAFDYRTIAEAVGRSEASCRKTMSRLRPKLAAALPEAGLLSAAEAEPLARQFLHAARTGDMQGMMELLHPDVVLRADGGGRVTAAVRPVSGASSVAAFLGGLFRKYIGLAANPESAPEPDANNAVQAAGEPLSLRSVNGRTGIVFTDGQTANTVFVVEASAGRITSVYVVRNPEKLERIRG